MRHGESQEKGQEESQEEVILLALCQWRARSLSLAASNSKTLPATSRAVSFQGPHFRSDVVSAQNTGKQGAARAALEFVIEGEVLGVGTGSTVNFLIDELAASRVRIAGAVSSSNGSTERLKAAG